jgi:hypothetical protein
MLGVQLEDWGRLAGARGPLYYTPFARERLAV